MTSLLPLKPMHYTLAQMSESPTYKIVGKQA